MTTESDNVAKLDIGIDEFLAGFSDGELSVDAIGHGMHMCFINARSLARDAEVLLPTSPARALSLGILALEELGKIILLAEVAARAIDGPISWRAVSKEFRLTQHRAKQVAATRYGSILGQVGRGYSKHLPPGMIPALDRFKQLGFYVDCFKGAFSKRQRNSGELTTTTLWGFSRW